MRILHPPLIPVHVIQVIGGIQRFNAILKINELGKVSGRKILTRRCSVYGKGLGRSATLLLAKQHNDFNQIQRITTFPEVSACCRRLLFSHFGDPGTVDDGNTLLSVPRYNSQAYREFKQECVTYLLSSQTVSTQS